MNKRNIWKEGTLSELCEIITGFPFQSNLFNSNGQGIRLVRGINITHGSLRWQNETRWWNHPLYDYSKYLLQEKDIVIGMDGSLVGKNYAKINENDLPLLLVQRVACLRAKSNCDNGFLYYLIAHENFEKYIESIRTGTTIFHISSKQIFKYLVSYPNISEQRAIARILSSLDDKIELNNRMNKVLEEMAQAIFKRWFVDFEFPDENGNPYKSSGGALFYNKSGVHPIDWRTGKITDLCSAIYSGGTPSTQEAEYWDGEIPWLSSGETRSAFIMSTERKITIEGIRNSSTRLSNKYDIVMASAGQGHTRGQTSILLLDTYINQSIIALKCKSNAALYLFFNLRSRYNELRGISDSSSIRGSLTTKSLAQLPIVIPSSVVLAKYHEALRPFISQIENNLSENTALKKIRDTLLPKLMSGEIRVPVAEA